MKKIYLACAAALLSSFTFAQSDKERNQLTLTTQQKKEILAGVDPAKVMRSHSRGSCDTLVTELTGGNSYNGNMFDMNALNLLTLETFSVTVDGTVNIAIYYRNGTYVGSTTTSAGWIFLDSAVVTGAGLGVPVQVPVSLGLTLTPSTTYGFYVSATDPAATFHYTDGTAVGTLHASDANLQFFEGHGGEWPFNLNNQPRVFNGNVIYCLGGVGIS
ncbi:MAG TPA: hypothetical protein VD905_04490, partial [Flavobacteriales bacterium]|nr:hypothetical protein [Flavobacteriales bacterium]